VCFVWGGGVLFAGVLGSVVIRAKAVVVVGPIDMVLIVHCSNKQPAGALPLPAPGQLVIGKITAARGSGVLVQLGWHALGIVALSDIHDAWSDNALQGVQEGAFVRARVLDGPPDARGRVRLTLRASEGGLIEGGGGGGKGGGAAAPVLLKAADLAEGQEVRGGGAFVCGVLR
jgi:hypothetical protein